MEIQQHMQISGHNNISEIFNTLVSEIKRKKNKFSVLDIGCGYGLYGFLLRSYYHNKVRLVGIDIKSPRKKWNLILENIYDEFIQEDIRSYKISDYYDIVIALHILEHLKKEEAFSLIKYLKKKTDYILIGLPRGKKNYIYSTDDDPNKHKWAYAQEDFPDFKILKTKSILLEWRSDE